MVDENREKYRKGKIKNGLREDWGVRNGWVKGDEGLWWIILQEGKVVVFWWGWWMERNQWSFQVIFVSER